MTQVFLAQVSAENAAAVPDSVTAILTSGGAIGYVLLAMSVVMLGLAFEQFRSVRRETLMPGGLADLVIGRLGAGDLAGARHVCRDQSAFLSAVVAAGLDEADAGPAAVESAAESVEADRTAALFRRVEGLSVIGTLAPMLGLTGTVWGMIRAFGEFARKANPQPSEFAPGISGALVTTLLGLLVAVPALAAYAYFRGRVDALTSEATAEAERVFSSYRRAVLARKRGRASGEAT